MYPLLATLRKDLLLLWRDRNGLLLMFLMPMALVLVISLVQNNILATTGGAAMRLLFVDQDHGTLARDLRRGLAEAGNITVVSQLDGKPLNPTRARQEIAAGHYQFGLVVPAGGSSRLRRLALRRIQGEFGLQPPPPATAPPVPVQLIFDPGVEGGYRAAIVNAVRYALLQMETAEQLRQLAAELHARFGGDATPPDSTKHHRRAMGELLQLSLQRAGHPETPHPNAVQQNVPAWALFGMFFIVVPMAGAMLRERQEGTLRRQLIAPSPYGQLLAGKILAYTIVCMIQFSLMLLVGRYLLPLLGTPVLHLGPHPGAVFLLALCAALAATGYGLLLGTLATSYDQASMFGSISVVIAAALGGLMVPVYVMPEKMQMLSQISPLAWGQSGFLQLFVRSGDLSSVSGDMGLLIAFFAVTLTLSLTLFSRRTRRGG